MRPARTPHAAGASVALFGALLWISTPAGSQAPPPVQPTPDAAAEEATLERAGWLDRVLYNARERTRRGLAALADERPDQALEPFRAAGRLAPDDGLAQFNTGAAELRNPDAEAGAARSLPHLSFAARHTTPDLAPLAHYNLGNAHLALSDPAAAVEAFKSSLRAEPSNPDAKINLEVALRELEKQKQEQEQQQQSDEPSDKNQEQDEQDRDQGDEPPPEQPEDAEDAEDAQDTQDENQPDPGEDQQQQPSPDFNEQPDMTAEQAAAILEAVENLEREQRRLDAAERARKGSKEGKDW